MQSIEKCECNLVSGGSTGLSNNTNVPHFTLSKTCSDLLQRLAPAYLNANNANPNAGTSFSMPDLSVATELYNSGCLTEYIKLQSQITEYMNVHSLTL